MAEKTLKVEIITPQEPVYSGDALSVIVPGALSPFEILFNHAPVVSSLELGSVRVVTSEGNKKWFATESGFVEVRNNTVSIMVETAEDAESIDSALVDGYMTKIKQKLESEISLTVKESLQRELRRSENKLKALNKLN